MHVYMNTYIPGLAKLIQEGLDLVGANGYVARVVESLTFRNASEDVVKVADQLRESQANFRFLFGTCCYISVRILERESQ